MFIELRVVSQPYDIEAQFTIALLTLPTLKTPFHGAQWILQTAIMSP